MSIRSAVLPGARPGVCSPQLVQAYADVGPWRAPEQLPVVYHDKYNIQFMGLEKLHPFDACKFRKVVSMLTKRGYLQQSHVQPCMATLEALEDVHDPKYIEAMHSSSRKVAQVVALPPVALLPSALVTRVLVHPMRFHVAGTMLAAALAMETGWAVNLGGGMHHAHRFDGDGWCPFDDIMLAVRRLRSASSGQVRRVLLVDLDAHQGNGVARDKLHFDDQDMFIVDVFNARNYPMDVPAKAGIDVRVELAPGTKDAEYLDRLGAALGQAAASGFGPDLVIYNAGTDPYELDPLGRLGVTAEGIRKRDEMVWQWAVEQLRVPICMLLSGGYAPDSARIIANSLAGLFDRFELGSGAVLHVDGGKAAGGG